MEHGVLARLRTATNRILTDVKKVERSPVTSWFVLEDDDIWIRFAPQHPPSNRLSFASRHWISYDYISSKVIKVYGFTNIRSLKLKVILVPRSTDLIWFSRAFLLFMTSHKFDNTLQITSAHRLNSIVRYSVSTTINAHPHGHGLNESRHTNSRNHWFLLFALPNLL